MNGEQGNPKKKMDIGVEMLNPKHVRRAANPAVNKVTVIALLASMAVVCALIVLLGAIFMILPLFRAYDVRVEGANYYSKEEIIAASGVQKGDDLLAIDSDKIIRTIFEAYPNVKHCKVKKGLFSLTIIIEEYEGLMQTSVQGSTVILDRDFLVLEDLGVGGTPRKPLLEVVLPPYSALYLKQKVFFVDAYSNLTYVARLWESLEAREWYENVTYADLSDRTAVAFVLKGHIRIEVGSTLEELDTKLLLAEQIMKEKREAGILTDDTYAIVNSSSTNATTWKLCSEQDLY